MKSLDPKKMFSIHSKGDQIKVECLRGGFLLGGHPPPGPPRGKVYKVFLLTEATRAGRLRRHLLGPQGGTPLVDDGSLLSTIGVEKEAFWLRLISRSVDGTAPHVR